MKYCFTKISLVLIALLTVCTASWAQLSVTGSVKDGNGEPLIGASILLKGTNVGTVTDFDGNFSLNLPGDSGTLEFSYTGFRTETLEVDANNKLIALTMEEDISNLDEIVVTGLGSSVKRSNLANSVDVIDAQALTGITVQPTMDAALYGKFKGAEIRSNSGAPGGGMSVKLRGVTSVFGDQQPLYIIDGIYVDNSAISSGTNIVSTAAGGGNTSSNQDDASNRIADIDPEDIESIEILKGASAAAIYGARAAGGVVIITTKKGKPGETRINLSQTVGFTQPITLLGTRDWTEERVRETFATADDPNGDLVADPYLESIANGTFTDYEAELYDNTGVLSTSRVSVSGGNEKVNYFIAGTYKNEDGIVDNTGYEKLSLRANVGVKLTEWLDIYFPNNFVRANADRGFFNNSNSNTTVGYALAFTRPWDQLFPTDGTYPANSRVGSNVLETVDLITNQEEINRYFSGIHANIRLFSNNTNNLKLMVKGGLDIYTLRTTSIFPEQLSYFRDPSSLSGVAVSGSTVNRNTNIEAILVHSLFLESGLSFRTQAGVIQLDFDQNTVITTGVDLIGSQTNVDQSASVSAFQNQRPQQDKGFFIQEEVNWKDRIIATFGVRGDKSSNNGDANEIYYYPKGNLALNISEFDFWSVDALNQLKLRAAYGEAGRFPNFPDRFNLLEGTVIGGNAGLQTEITNGGLRGNTDVEPETQTELEFGIDLGFLNNKLNIDFTYYIKTIEDLLLRAQIPTSTGFTRQVINGGELENRGIEIGLNATPFQGDFTWVTGVNFWRNQSEVTRLDVPAFNLGGFAASLGQYRIQEGKSATQIVGTFNPEDCGTPDCSDLDPDGDGFRVYGDAEPDFNIAFTNSFFYKNFEFNFLIHWKEGGEGVNLSTLLYDLGGTTWDYDDTNLDPAGVTPNGVFRTTEWFAGNAGPWIEDNSYMRLREIGLFYNIPRSVFNDVASMRVGFSGRNLINVFDYNSYDPEVSNFGGNVLANNIEVTPFPSNRRFNFHISVNF